MQNLVVNEGDLQLSLTELNYLKQYLFGKSIPEKEIEKKFNSESDCNIYPASTCKPQQKRVRFDNVFDNHFRTLLLECYARHTGQIFETTEKLVDDYQQRRPRPKEMWRELDTLLGRTYNKYNKFSYLYFAKHFLSVRK